jgi:hypothetical protein
MRDIEELAPLAHEIQVCLSKSGNYHDTARSKIAEVSPALERGEFGDWRTQDWVAIHVGVTEIAEIRRLMPPALEMARQALALSPHKSDRAIAKRTGASPRTVGRARSTAAHAAVESRVGIDGRERRLPAKRPPSRSAMTKSDPVDELMVRIAALSTDDFARFKNVFRVYCGG